MKKIASMTLLAAILVAGCATAPTGPSVLVLQGSAKTFEEFNRDDIICRDYAARQLGGKGPGKTGQDASVSSAVVGTAIGAVAGAALGGRDGAAVGAGTGLIVGTAAGAESGQAERGNSQRMYDHAYVQCMYGYGHRVPVPAGMFQAQTNAAPGAPPPPPKGTPPPPPRGASVPPPPPN